MPVWVFFSFSRIFFFSRQKASARTHVLRTGTYAIKLFTVPQFCNMDIFWGRPAFRPSQSALFCLVSTVSGRSKNIGSESGHTLSAHLPCQPICHVSQSAMLAHMPCWPIRLVGPSALLAHLPYWPICLVGPSALSAHLPCQPICLVSPSVMSAHLPC